MNPQKVYRRRSLLTLPEDTASLYFMRTNLCQDGDVVDLLMVLEC